MAEAIAALTSITKTLKKDSVENNIFNVIRS